MATEPKVTRLAPGEGAGDFRRKQGGQRGKGAKRGTPQGQKRTQNPCILSDGSVDPQCKKVYQRSVAGREKLEDYVKRLDSSGASEKDVFMAAVDSLMNRGHGYVGAYLDSKSPNRTYNKNQAMKIADSVMSKADVGDNPGARLTPEDADAKGARAEKRAAGGSPEPGAKAMPVGQQRKQPGGRGGGAGMPESWAKPGEKDASRPIEKPEQRQKPERPAPKTDLQRTLDEYKAGKLSKEQLAERLKKKIEGEGALPPSAPPLPGSAAAASRDASIERKKEQEADPESVSTPISEDKTPAPAEESVPTPAEEKAPTPAEEGDTGLRVSDDQIAALFRTKYNKERKSALERAQAAARKNREIAPKSVELSPDDLEFLAQDTIDELSEQFEVDSGKAIAAINKKFGLKIPVPGAEQQPATTTEQPQASKDVKYTKPNFQKEWDEANRYPEFESAGIEGWKKAAEKGSPVKYSQIQDQLGNVDLDYDSLEGEKKQRFEQAFQQGQIETPIAVKFDDGSYDLVAGNTRLSGLVKNGVDPSIWVVDVKDLEQTQPPAEQATPPAREKLPEERLGRGKARAKSSASGFTPEAKTKAKTAIKQAVQEGKTPEQVVEEYKQGTLFPGGLATDTAATNPLEGGSTPEPTQESPELAPSSALPDESRPVAESPGQKTFLKKGSETSKKPQILPSSIQVPKPAQGVTDAQSYTKQLQKANIPSAMIDKAVKDTYGSRSAKRRRGTTSSSEYQQFSDAVRQVVKLRSAQQPLT
jgi:hypothetical protein